MHAFTHQSTAHPFRLGQRWSSTTAPKRATAALPCHGKGNAKAGQAKRPSNQLNSISVRQANAQANDRQTASGFQAGPSEERPSYTAIDAVLLNKGIMSLFRQKMVDAIGQDSQETGYTSLQHSLLDLMYDQSIHYILIPLGMMEGQQHVNIIPKHVCDV